MTKIELLEYLKNMAIEYREKAAKSIHNNNHMNELVETDTVESKMVDALLVDFINYIGNFQGVDYGLYTYDLKMKKDNDREKFSAEFLKNKSRLN